MVCSGIILLQAFKCLQTFKVLTLTQRGHFSLSVIVLIPPHCVSAISSWKTKTHVQELAWSAPEVS